MRQTWWYGAIVLAHLGAIQTDDAVDIARAVVEVGDSDGVLACWQPVLFSVGVNLEDMGSRAVDGLLPEGHKKEVVNFFVPKHQCLTKSTTCKKTPVAHGRVRSPWQRYYQLPILHDWSTKKKKSLRDHKYSHCQLCKLSHCSLSVLLCVYFWPKHYRNVGWRWKLSNSAPLQGSTVSLLRYGNACSSEWGSHRGTGGERKGFRAKYRQ